VSAANSLVGSATSDLVGNGLGIALPNGNYLIASSSWANGAAKLAGAITWGQGASATGGAVSAANSLVGESNDQLGSNVFRSFADGYTVVKNPYWSNGGASAAGAVTLIPDDEPTTGLLTADNSLVGTVMDGADFISFDYNPLPHLLAVGWSQSNTVTLRRAERIFRNGFESL
jgi:hypothetical protein